MAFCTACGNQLTDNARFCANCGATSDGKSARAEASTQPTGSERVLYQDASGALVSTTRAVLASVTYPISSISSVRKAAVGKSCWGPVLGVIGLIALIGGIGDKDLGVGVFGAIALVIAGAIVNAKGEVAIVLATTGGETTALKSYDRAAITAIVEALNQAIVERG